MVVSMTWLFLSLASALSESVKDTFAKMGSMKTNEYAAAISLHATTCIFMLPLVIYEGIPSLRGGFWWSSAAFLFITPAWSILYMKALRLSELSKVIPLMAFNPIFTALLGLLVFQETISLAGWLGILCISVGIYSVNSNPQLVRTDWLSPLKNMVADRGAQAMLGVAFLWSLGAHLSKIRVDGSTPIFATFTGGLIGLVTVYAVALYLHQTISLKTYFRHKGSFLTVGFFNSLTIFLSSLALQTGTATYVSAVKRGSIVASLFTGKIFFGERISRYKAVGVAVITVGIVLLSLS